MSTRIIKAYGGTITLTRVPGDCWWMWEAWRPAAERVVWGNFLVDGVSAWGICATRRKAWKAAVRAVR
jgi:hypothetical protein